MNMFAHAETLFNSPWQASAHLLRDISLHYPGIRLFTSALKMTAVFDIFLIKTLRMCYL